MLGYMRVSSDCDRQTTDRGLEIVLLCPTLPSPPLVMSIAEGDQLANEQSQDYRLRFAEALPRTAETGLIFRLAPKPGAF